uniref:Prephenate dehydratase n=1 Tax=Zarconia navalis LEGE 11467 TaxID=1828826 RepID=A0A928VWI0_9CYAN|nr:prephenate dehydratase [Zarconia navalis]MBE9039541.1 prephenate dehydratase [Zarconia navalis LEGE 11467]
MTISIAHLGPAGTYSEAATLAYVDGLKQRLDRSYVLKPYSSIARTLQAVVRGEAQLGVVPVENSLGGSVAVALDTLWQLDALTIQQALVLPISHALLARADALSHLNVVYSHPQALAQCQLWLERYLPTAQLLSTQSTTEALEKIHTDRTIGAIASSRAGQLYDVPVLAHPINDRLDNCTRFWVVSQSGFNLGVESPATELHYVSLAFSLPKNLPGALVHPLQVLAARGINMSRIESRPAKRSLGEYLFFIDFEAPGARVFWEDALKELETHTEIFKVWGHYSVWHLCD